MKSRKESGHANGQLNWDGNRIYYIGILSIQLNQSKIGINKLNRGRARGETCLLFNICVVNPSTIDAWCSSVGWIYRWFVRRSFEVSNNQNCWEFVLLLFNTTHCVQWILHNCIHRSIITCSRSHCCVYSELWSTWHFCINKIWSHLNLFLGRGFAPLLSDRFIKMLLHKYLNSLAPKSLSHVFPFSAIILYWHILYLIRLSITEIKFNSSNWFS